MKYNFIILKFIVLFFIPSFQSFAQCKPKQIVEECKEYIKPYIFDGSVVTDLLIYNEPQLVELVFDATAHTNYKLVFGTAGLDEKVTIFFYDRNRNALTRNKLGEAKVEKDNSIWSYETPKTAIYYIEISVDAGKTNKEKESCIVMLIGIKE
jgi:hypothetical protein